MLKPSPYTYSIQPCRLDKTKLYVVGAGLFSGVTVALYPASVIKTRMQVASKDAAQNNAFAAIRNILKVLELINSTVSLELRNLA